MAFLQEAVFALVFFFSPRAKTMEIYPLMFPVEKMLCFFKLLCDYWPVLVLSVGAAKPDLCSLSPWPATSAVARSRWSFSLTGSYILLWWWLSVFYLLSCVCRLFVCFRFLLQFTLWGWSCPSTTKHSHYWMEKVSENKLLNSYYLYVYISIYLYTPSIFPLKPLL